MQSLPIYTDDELSEDDLALVQALADAGIAYNPPRNRRVRYDVAVLNGLQGQRHVYGGTVPPDVIAARRKANRAARRARRINRKGK